MICRACLTAARTLPNVGLGVRPTVLGGLSSIQFCHPVHQSPRLAKMSSDSKVLSMDTLNPNIKAMEYAVRGAIVTRAAEIEKEIAGGAKKPFDKVIRANIGDAHAMGQQPITWIRQVVSLCMYPELLNDSKFPEDVKARARKILSGAKGSSVDCTGIGSYSDSVGIECIRQDIAKYITERDGVPCDHNNIFLCTGASDGIKSIMKLHQTGRHDVKCGVMVPIPQYPLYTATVSEYNSHLMPYYLNEEKKWGLDTEELQRSFDEHKGSCKPRILVVINPGNPTGQVLDRKNIEDIIKFAHKNNLFIMADEVYQHNIYAKGSAFYSFKKCMIELGGDYKDMELASFMSMSKGYMGECGFRGGYCEAINLDADVKAQLIKSLSAKLCPPVTAQAAMSCALQTPQPGDPSYDLFKKEKDHVLGQLKLKAQMTSETLNKIKGVSCNEVMGAMYAFPRIQLPERIIKEAEAKGQKPDFYYCYNLLEQTGICVVPGSGFGQKEGTFHFRMTILPSVELLEVFLGKFKDFHEKFTA